MAKVRVLLKGVANGVSWTLTEHVPKKEVVYFDAFGSLSPFGTNGERKTPHRSRPVSFLCGVWGLGPCGQTCRTEHVAVFAARPTSILLREHKQIDFLHDRFGGVGADRMGAKRSHSRLIVLV
jgi:hypothetical protein